MTPSMKSALIWLRNRGGDGVFAERNRQVLLARGERCHVRRSTWNKLLDAGLVELYTRHRLRVTATGAAIDLSDVAEPYDPEAA